MKRLPIYCYLFMLFMVSCHKDDIDEEVVNQKTEITEARQYFENYIDKPYTETSEEQSSRS